MNSTSYRSRLILDTVVMKLLIFWPMTNGAYEIPTSSDRVGFRPAKMFFEDLEEIFALLDTPIEDKFKIAWSRLTGKAKSWANLNVTPWIMATYANLQEIFLLALPAQNIKWILVRDLYATLQENNEESLQFLMNEQMKYHHVVDTAFLDNFMFRFGTQLQIVSDNRNQFASNVFEQLCQDLNTCS